MIAGRVLTGALGTVATVWLGAMTAGATRLPAVGTASAVPAPPARLSETGLYAAPAVGVLRVADGIESFSPQYPLWSDGLTKRRWIALPPGAAIDATDPYAWNFPVGTKLWKEFALGERRIETRLFWRATPTAWVAATYVWNADGTDADLAPPEGVRGVAEIAPGRRHNVPSRDDCATCHGPTETSRVLGVNALQLSIDRDPEALHGEPLRPDMVTVATLAAAGRFGPTPPAWVDTPVRIAARPSSARPVLGYLATNCGMCHDGSRTIAGFDASLATRDVVTDPEAVVARLIDRPTRWQAPGQPDGQTTLVRPGASAASAIYLRMKSRSPSSQMAPLGTLIRDDEAVAAVGRWIDVDLAPNH